MPLLRNQGQMLIRKAHCLLCSLWDSRARAGDPEACGRSFHISKGGQSPRAVVSQILGHYCTWIHTCVHINRSGNMEISMIFKFIFLNVRIIFISSLLGVRMLGACHRPGWAGLPAFQAFDTQQACVKPGWWAGPWRMVLPHEL